MNKDLIEKRFTKGLETYNQNASVQKKMAEHLITMLQSNEYDNILELGCGTGLLTEIAINKLNYKQYTAIDIADCKKYMDNFSSDINFIKQDMEKYIQNNSQKYDLIISNASLQWVDNLQEFTSKLILSLNEGGILLFSTFGKENFREINFALNKTLNYYSTSQLKEMLSIYNADIEEEIRILAFKTPYEILKHISSTGVNALEQTFWTKSDLKNFEQIYYNICSNSPTLTYNPIYIKIG